MTGEVRLAATAEPKYATQHPKLSLLLPRQRPKYATLSRQPHYATIPTRGRGAHQFRGALIPSQHYDSACFTRSGENGTRRMRTPVASKIALAMAAATGRIDGSPPPVGAISGRSINATSIASGVSVMSRMG